MVKRPLIVFIAGCASRTVTVVTPPVHVEVVVVQEAPVITVVTPLPSPPEPAPVTAPEPTPDPTCDDDGDDDTFHAAHHSTLRWNSKPKLLSYGGSTTAWLQATETFVACPGDFDVMRIDIPAMSGWYGSMVVTWDPKEGDLSVEQLTPSGVTKPASQFEPGTAVVSAMFDEAARITAPKRMRYRVRFQADKAVDGS